MNNNLTQDQADDLTIRMAKADTNLYVSLADFYHDVQSETYRRSEVFRQICDARLEQSKHLWENNPLHRVSDGSGQDSLHMKMNWETGDVREVHAGDTGTSSEPVPSGSWRGHECHGDFFLNHRDCED